MLPDGTLLGCSSQQFHMETQLTEYAYVLFNLSKDIHIYKIRVSLSDSIGSFFINSTTEISKN